MEPYLSRVVDASDSNSKALGFLRRGVFPQYAAQSKLWVATEVTSNLYVGHLLFGARYPYLKVIQLFVAASHRHAKVGTRLINELIAYGEEGQYIAISARVASDLPANVFWSKLGFDLTRQLPGGRTSGRTINVRERPLDVPLLFDLRDPVLQAAAQSTLNYEHLPLLRTPTYALDLSAILELLRHRDSYAGVGSVFRAACNGQLRLVVTEEATVELLRNRAPSDIKDNPHIEFVRQIPSLPAVPKAQLVALTENLRRLVFPERSPHRARAEQDASDLRHLAACVHFRISGFVTLEKAMLRAAQPLQKEHHLEVLAPAELSDFEEEPTGISPLVATIEDAELLVGRMEEVERQEALSFLRKLRISEEESAEMWAPAVQGAHRERLTASVGGTIVAVAAWEVPTKLQRELSLFLYVDEASEVAERAIDHLIEAATRASRPAGVCRLVLHASPSQSRTRALATARGFRSTTLTGRRLPQLVKICIPEVVSSKKWDSLRRELAVVSDLHLPPKMPSFDDVQKRGLPLARAATSEQFSVDFFSAETLFSPGLVLYPGRSGVIVPIQEHYAEELLGAVRQQQSLLPRQEALLRVEKAYFRSASRVGIFAKGMPVVFYVSGEGNGAIASARITSSKTLTTDEAAFTYTRQGVLSKEDLRGLAKGRAHLHAFTFDNLIPFRRKVGFRRLRDLNCVSGAGMVTAEPLSHASLEALMAEGAGGKR